MGFYSYKVWNEDNGTEIHAERIEAESVEHAAEIRAHDEFEFEEGGPCIYTMNVRDEEGVLWSVEVQNDYETTHVAYEAVRKDTSEAGTTKTE